MSRLQIRFPRFEVWGRPEYGRPLAGLYVGKGGWSGWDDAAPGRREAIVRPSDDGEFDMPVLRGARVLSISPGVALAGSERELGELRALVTGLGSDRAPFPMTVKHQGQMLTATARLLDASFVDSGRGSGAGGAKYQASFSLDMVCADPRKYGLLRRFEGNPAEVFHLGNFPAQSKITVSGVAASGYTVTGPGGRRVVVSKPLTAGAPHVIDFAVGGLFVGGARQTGAVTIWEPWAVPAGVPVTVSVTGGLALAVELHDTFI